jgi:hypothetical protein
MCWRYSSTLHAIKGSTLSSAHQRRLHSNRAPPPRAWLQAPYHLINTALNVPGSTFANRRGRNADFFLFSRCFAGSEATGYAPTELVEQATDGLNIGTAMAISGAAARSEHGRGIAAGRSPPRSRSSTCGSDAGCAIRSMSWCGRSRTTAPPPGGSAGPGPHTCCARRCRQARGSGARWRLGDGFVKSEIGKRLR